MLTTSSCPSNTQFLKGVEMGSSSTKLTVILDDDLMWRQLHTPSLLCNTWSLAEQLPLPKKLYIVLWLALLLGKKSKEPFRCCFSIDLFGHHRIDNVPPSPATSIGHHHVFHIRYVNGILLSTWIKHQMDRMCVDSISHPGPSTIVCRMWPSRKHQRPKSSFHMSAHPPTQPDGGLDKREFVCALLNKSLKSENSCLCINFQ